MSLTLDDDTLTHLDRTRETLVREFELSQQEVDERFDQIVRELLSEATLGDYVPILAWRYSREALRASMGVPGEFRTLADQPSRVACK